MIHDYLHMLLLGEQAFSECHGMNESGTFFGAGRLEVVDLSFQVYGALYQGIYLLHQD